MRGVGIFLASLCGRTLCGGFFVLLGPFPLRKVVYSEGKGSTFLCAETSLSQPPCQKCKTSNLTLYQQCDIGRVQRAGEARRLLLMVGRRHITLGGYPAYTLGGIPAHTPPSWYTRPYPTLLVYPHPWLYTLWYTRIPGYAPCGIPAHGPPCDQPAHGPPCDQPAHGPHR